MEDGFTREEWKMVAETKKIVDPAIKVVATCVRVPVFVGHSEAINVEFEDPLDEDEAREILREAPGVLVVDKREAGGYVTPVECVGDYATFVSRIRTDPTVENGLMLWVVSDNLRKGAALNAVQIAELLGRRVLKKGLRFNDEALTAGLSPNALRARAVIFELGLPVELEEVNLADAAAKVATLRPCNPNTKVPVLVDGDFVLWESRAIIAYLASGTPLYPSDPKRRAIIDQWMYWGAIHLGPALQAVSFQRFMKARFGMGAPDEAAIAPQREGDRAVPAGARRRPRRQGVDRRRAQHRRLRHRDHARLPRRRRHRLLRRAQRPRLDGADRGAPLLAEGRRAGQSLHRRLTVRNQRFRDT